MNFYNTIYLFRLKSEVFIKCVKTFPSLNIKYKNLKYQNCYFPIYSLINHQLYPKTSRPTPRKRN